MRFSDELEVIATCLLWAARSYDDQALVVVLLLSSHVDMILLHRKRFRAECLHVKTKSRAPTLPIY